MFLSSLSVEYVRVDVVATIDPTSGTVAFAFTSTGSPSSWTNGGWEGGATEDAGSGYFTATARILVGPGQATLPTGSVTVWVRTSAAPESVVKVAGVLNVT